LKSQKSQQRLTDREVELVRQQLDNSQRAQRESKQANVSARLYNIGNNSWKLRVFNKGPAVATNVDVEPQLAVGSMFSVDWLKKKLPMAQMDKGDSVEILAHVHLGTPAKETIILRWDDPSGLGQRKEVEVTL
jgi:hypothetical protein